MGELSKIKKRQNRRAGNTFMSAEALRRYAALCDKLEYPRVIGVDGKEYYVIPIKKQGKQ